jgi:hypothetical protein
VRVVTLGGVTVQKCVLLNELMDVLFLQVRSHTLLEFNLPMAEWV